MLDDVDSFNVIANCVAYATAKSGAIPGEDLYMGFSLHNPSSSKDKKIICKVLLDIIPEKCQAFMDAFEEYLENYSRLDYGLYYLKDVESALIGHQAVNKKIKVNRVGIEIFTVI